MMQPADFRVEDHDGIPVAEIVGEIDFVNAAQLDEVLLRLARPDRGTAIVSLDRVRYFDSRAIHSLTLFIERMRVNRQRALIVLPKIPSARRIFEITGLIRLAPSYDSLEEALAAARKP